jgi:hypothetical protein
VSFGVGSTGSLMRSGSPLFLLQEESATIAAKEIMRYVFMVFYFNAK